MWVQYIPDLPTILFFIFFLYLSRLRLNLLSCWVKMTLRQFPSILEITVFQPYLSFSVNSSFGFVKQLWKALQEVNTVTSLNCFTILVVSCYQLPTLIPYFWQAWLATFKKRGREYTSNEGSLICWWRSTNQFSYCWLSQNALDKSSMMPNLQYIPDNFSLSMYLLIVRIAAEDWVIFVPTIKYGAQIRLNYYHL